MNSPLLRSVAFAAMLSASSIAYAQPTELAAQQLTAASAADPQFAQFTPSDAPNSDRIDYSIWDEAMRNLVVSMGPSLRQTPGTAQQSLGTRRQYGHTSRYRLEGTRIMFSFLDSDVIASFTEYRQDLERTADLVDIQALSRNEQLAYWINLHNVSVIEQIAKEWPVRQPRDLEINGVPMDDAKFITVNGVAMSPKDIRTQIVYRHWQNPKVIYGFWRGDIGGPSIQREAFNADNVSRLLDRGARDFVNSLRGTQKRGDRLQVSKIYEEAAPFFFDDFGSDLRAHIALYANEDVAEILAETTRTEAAIDEADIADLAGGVREPSYSNVTTDGVSTRFRIPQSMARLLQERETKFRRVIKRGRTGTVTFSNIQLPGDPENKNEVE